MPRRPALRPKQSSAGAYRIYASRGTGRLAAQALQAAGIEQDAAVPRLDQWFEICDHGQSQILFWDGSPCRVSFKTAVAHAEENFN